jgi:ABC-type multidrug transport system fused ATPase/permease subunit
VAEAVGIHDHIKKLENGYNTMVGQSEKTLSGGEIALIQLLRICILDEPPPIIVLDEPNSALDPITEADILGKVFKRFPKSIIIVATHKLRLIERARLILCLKNGEIMEAGMHDELMTRPGGYYAEMWVTQNCTTV